MTHAYITIDTEYSSGLFGGPGEDARRDNFQRSIACETPKGPGGIQHQLSVLAKYGQRAVFYVDPMPALVWGVAAIEDIIGPIVEAGQDVQLHIHTEWIALAGSDNPLGEATGTNIADFAFEDQCVLLDFARTTLMAAGAPKPVAFRAGNYGANDDTLRALAELGIRYDSSHCPGIADGYADISLGSEDREPVYHCGVIEVPAGCIATIKGGLRHAQITALSLGEMTAALRHARDTKQNAFTLVSHSFELINRRTLTLNSIVAKRFEGLVKALSELEGIESGNFRDNPPQVIERAGQIDVLPAEPLRTGWRLAEQAVSNTLYGAL
ncbi:MAG: hypothetical protein AAGK02_05285 [Pseudomonadota bacterium]